MPSTVVTTLSTTATIGSTSDRSASAVTAAPVLHHPRPMPPMMPKTTSTIESIHSSASTSSYTSSVSAYPSSTQTAHKVNLTQSRPKLVFPPSSSGAAVNIQVGSSSGMMPGARVPAPVPVPVSAPSQTVQWNSAPAPTAGSAVQPRALSPVSPEELEGAISLARKGSALKGSGRMWMSGLEATFGSKGSRSRSVSPVPPTASPPEPPAKVEASVPIVAPTPVRVTSVTLHQHQQHQQQSRRRYHAARQSDVPSSSHGPHHHGPGGASTTVTYTHAPSTHQQQSGRPTTLNRRNTSSSSSFAQQQQQQQHSSSSSASQSIYSSQLHERKQGSRQQSQHIQPSEDLNVPPSRRISLKESAATSGVPPPPPPPVAISRRLNNHRNPSQEPVGPVSLPHSLERTDSRSQLSAQLPPRPPPEQQPSRMQLRTQQRTRNSAPALSQKQIVQLQREQEERQRQEREWRAHQAQPTPHQQLVQEVENLPTNQRSSYLLQRSGSYLGQSHSENSSAFEHGFLNGSGSHIDHGTSTAVSAWTGRGVEIGTRSGTNTNAASMVNYNKNMSQLSVAVNVGAGVRRGSADISHPSHGDDEDDEEPARARNSGVYDIRSWLAHRGSRSSYFNVSGVTGPSAALVEQMGGVAPFVTQANPQVGRKPTGESAGTGTSAAATPTTAVQSRVRFTPDHLFVTLESKKTIKIHNLPPPNAHDKSYQNHSVIKAVRRQVVGLWPGGSKEDVEERGEWWVKLGGEGNAWGAGGNGSEGITARRMVAQLFKVFAAEGYSYLCSVHTSRPFQPARHVFASAPAAPDTNFFVLSFSLNRRKVSLIDAPTAIVNDLKKSLVHAAPYGLEEDRGKGGQGSRRKKSSTSSEHPAFAENSKAWSLAGSTASIVAERNDYFGGAGKTATSRGIFTVRLKNRHPVTRPKNEIPLFLPRNEDSDMLSTLSNLMKVFTTHNYRLDASVPMGRAKGIRGWFGLRGRREIWVFKEVEFQPMASK